MPEIAELRSHTGYLMRTVSNAVSHAFAQRVAGESVTVAEWALMRTLYDGEPCAPSLLAERMGLTRGAVSKLADRLCAKGFLHRAGNPEDKRAHTLSLTPQGRVRVPILAGMADANDAAFFGALSDEEHATLRGLLDALIERRGLRGTPID